MFSRASLALLLSLSVASLAACKKKDEAKPGGETATKPVEVEKPVVDEGPAIAAVELPTDLDAPLGTDKKTIKGTLDNGLVYYIRPNKTPEKRAEFWISIDAGSFQEDEEQRGLAHFVEHMAFNGTKSFPKNELISKLQKLGVDFGAHLNAYTSFDETVYKLRLPTDDPETVDLGLHILSEWASAISFEDKDVDAERGVVLAEKRSRDGAQMRMMQSVIESVFEGTRYANRLPIGLPKVLEKAPTKVVKRFFNDWYHPGNMAVYVVGDIDPGAIEAKIKERFGAIAAQDKPRAAPKRNAISQGALKFIALQDEELPIQAVALGRLSEARETKSINDFRETYIEMMAVLMLGKRLEEAQMKGNARYIMAGGAPAPIVRSARVLAFFAMVKEDEIAGGLEDLLTEISRASQHGFTQGEYDRAIKDLLTSVRSSAKEDAAGKERSEALVAELTRHQLSGEGMPGRAAEFAVMQQLAKTVPVTEIHAPLKGYLKPEGLIGGNIGNNKEAVTKDSFMAMLETVAKKQLVPYADEKSDEPLIAEAPSPGTIASEKKHSDVDVTEWTLSNGATVVLKKTDFKEDEILFRASSPGGMSLLETDKLPAVRMAVGAVERGGVGNFDSTALGKALAGRDVELGAYISEHEEGLQGSTGLEDLETLMQLTHLRFTAPRKDQKAFDLFKEEQEESVAMAAKNPETRFSYKLTPYLDNTDPRISPWDAKAAKSLELDASFDFYKDRLSNAGDFTFYFVGNFDEAKLKPLVLTYIGSLPDAGRREEFKLHAWQSHGKSKVLQVKDGTQKRATIVFGFERTVPAEVSTPKARLAWNLVGAAMQMRFLELFREEMGATYGVGVRTGWDQRWTQAEMKLSFQCEPKRATELRKAALVEITRLHTEGITADHFAKAKEAMVKRNETELQRNPHWLGNIAYAYFNKRPLSEIIEEKALIDSLTEADLKAAQASFAAVDKPAIGVLLPKK
jgi:zinc protease